MMRANATARASKCRDLAKQAAIESQRWDRSTSTRRQLMVAAQQLGYLARAGHEMDPMTVEAYIESAEDMLARTMTARAFGGAP